jgi:hypothetical protein
MGAGRGQSGLIAMAGHIGVAIWSSIARMVSLVWYVPASLTPAWQGK